jgi:phospholipid N-methyltransferase
MQNGNRISLNEEYLYGSGEDGRQLKQLIEREFLIPDGYDPLPRFVNQFVARPIQNPALTYRSKDGNIHLVRTSLSHQVFSPVKGELPEVIEEEMSPFAAAIFDLADGTKTLQEIFAVLGRNKTTVDDPEFREALEFLSSRERQLIKFTSQPEDLENPYEPVNIVPRDLYHSSKWNAAAVDSLTEPIIDFHLSGIEDAQWEFDLIEPTVNHSFRFPNEALGGLDYGSRFCVSTLRPDVVPSLQTSERVAVLEVGGGTGTFARSFLQQSKRLEVLSGIRLDYHILDLSPALIENQKNLLADILPPNSHFHQDATKFSIPQQRFDMIIANEVIADFPVAVVERSVSDTVRKWQGPGAAYVERYGLATENAAASFLVNAGAFEFIERCFEHLAPGGALLVSEYGTAERYPVEAHQLNHEEFSIHFGHLAACAANVGFKCRLLTLKEFLAVDDSILVLNGRQDHFLTLNYVLKKYGMSLPYAVISKTEFETRLQKIIEQIELKGFSFSALSKGYYAGPKIDDFMILIMTKPPE